jgi:hypothetical protein
LKRRALLLVAALTAGAGAGGAAVAQLFSGRMDLKTIEFRQLTPDEGSPVAGEDRTLKPGDTFLRMSVGGVRTVQLTAPMAFDIDGRRLTLPVGQEFFLAGMASNGPEAAAQFCAVPPSNRKNPALLAVLEATSPPQRKGLAKYRALCVLDVGADGAFDQLVISAINLGSKVAIPEANAALDAPVSYRALPSAKLADSSFSVEYGIPVIGGPSLQLKFREDGKSLGYDWASIIHGGVKTEMPPTLDINTAKLPQRFAIGDGVLTVTGYDARTRAVVVRYDKPISFQAFELKRREIIYVYLAH